MRGMREHIEQIDRCERRARLSKGSEISCERGGSTTYVGQALRPHRNESIPDFWLQPTARRVDGHHRMLQPFRENRKLIFDSARNELHADSISLGGLARARDRPRDTLSLIHI